MTVVKINAAQLLAQAEEIGISSYVVREPAVPHIERVLALLEAQASLPGALARDRQIRARLEAAAAADERSGAVGRGGRPAPGHQFLRVPAGRFPAYCF